MISIRRSPLPRRVKSNRLGSGGVLAAGVFCFFLVLFVVPIAIAGDLKPSDEEAARLLEQVRETALDYTRSLPDFICTQVVKRYIDTTGRDRWTLADTLNVRLSYFGQKEDYKLLLIDNKPTTIDYMQAGGAASKGEFGTILKAVFDPESYTEFHWKNWTTIRKRHAAVRYRVERARSSYRISIQLAGDDLQETLAAFHGEIFVDRETNMVLHMTTVAELPLSFPMKQSATSLDYDVTDVGGRKFLLPLSAEVEMRSIRLHSKNTVAFHSYHTGRNSAVKRPIGGNPVSHLP